MPLESMKPPRKPLERSQTPLWFVAGGLGVALYTRIGGESQIHDVVFWLSLVMAGVALVYWIINPRHGF
ncbi:MAG TPA: hypothetical protein VED87_00450 [Methylocystis sp.]|nr:hypothetical protein [Methylocystis sp.]